MSLHDVPFHSIHTPPASPPLHHNARSTLHAPMIIITAGHFTSFLPLDRLSSIVPAIAPAIRCMLRETRIASDRIWPWNKSRWPFSRAVIKRVNAMHERRLSLHCITVFSHECSRVCGHHAHLGARRVLSFFSHPLTRVIVNDTTLQGIGLECVRLLARGALALAPGSTVYMCSRDLRRGEEALKKVKEEGPTSVECVK
jgi:hypothetical protein